MSGVYLNLDCSRHCALGVAKLFANVHSETSTPNAPADTLGSMNSTIAFLAEKVGLVLTTIDRVQHFATES